MVASDTMNIAKRFTSIFAVVAVSALLGAAVPAASAGGAMADTTVTATRSPAAEQQDNQNSVISRDTPTQSRYAKKVRQAQINENREISNGYMSTAKLPAQ